MSGTASGRPYKIQINSDKVEESVTVVVGEKKLNVSLLMVHSYCLSIYLSIYLSTYMYLYFPLMHN